ncbi:MAG: alpha/beta fold hydrolase [Planctomycetes bacterium]|nr:alpha/beta fold hydrolase [Planctomycetota bacterium]
MRYLGHLGSVLVLPALLSAQQPELAPLRAAADRIVQELKLPGCGLAVVRDGGVLHRSLHGTLLGDEVLPIASASKWLAVATVLTLVEDGTLDLDVPVGRYVKEFDRADKGAVTLRLCLSNTSGLPARLGERMRGWDSTQFAAAAADAALRDGVGQMFLYGGVGFQVAAVAAERATGRSWHQLFADRIAGPLGMQDTKFGTLQPLGGEPGTAKLPWVAGGALSTLDDYTRFLRMLVGNGSTGGKQILKAASVEAMLRDQVPPRVQVRAVGFEAEHVRYGLGTWLEELPGGGQRASDPGALGFTPWLDRDLDIGGVFAVRDRVDRVLPRLRRLQDEVRAVVQSPLVSGTDVTVAIAHGGRDRRYLLHVPPQAATAQGGLPLVVVLHGGGGNGELARELTGFTEVADREGFLVAFPDGTGALRGKLLTWNSGGIPVYAVEQEVDDVGFLRAVVADVQRRAAVATDRVFAVGHSNGAMLCHRLARQAADVFAGIAAVSGAMNFTAADSKLPIAVLIVHGTADQHVLYAGGAPKQATGRAGERKDASVQDAVDYYVARNGLRDRPESRQDGKVRTDSFGVTKDGDLAAAVVRVITLEGGGHAWPGSVARTRLRADEPFPFDATNAIWAFFAGVRRAPGRPAPGEAAPGR